MLKTMPSHWFTWDCRVLENRTVVATIGFSVWGEAGQIQIHDDQYQVYRQNPQSSTFFLATCENCVALAEKPNPLFRQFFISSGDQRYELQATSPQGREFLIQQYGQVMGSIRPAHGLTRQAVVDVPDDIPLTVRLFMVWLVLTLWRRQAGH